MHEHESRMSTARDAVEHNTPEPRERETLAGLLITLSKVTNRYAELAKLMNDTLYAQDRQNSKPLEMHESPNADCSVLSIEDELRGAIELIETCNNDMAKLIDRTQHILGNASLI